MSKLVAILAGLFSVTALAQDGAVTIEPTDKLLACPFVLPVLKDKMGNVKGTGQPSPDMENCREMPNPNAPAKPAKKPTQRPRVEKGMN